MKNVIIDGYKGFDKNLKCRDFQYEIGKEYEMDGYIKCCKRGFHACESPIDVLKYYFLSNDAVIARFCEVEQSGNIDRRNDDNKIASSKIKIKTELKFRDFIEAGIEWLIKKTYHENARPHTEINLNSDYAKIGLCCDFAKISSNGCFIQIGSSGDFAQISSSCHATTIFSSGNHAFIASTGAYNKIASIGNYAQIASSGDFVRIISDGKYTKIVSSGNSTRIASIGENNIICCSGMDSIVSAKQGSWITLTEWVFNSKSGSKFVPKCTKTEYVDGIRIKANVGYRLMNGEFVEVKE